MYDNFSPIRAMIMKFCTTKNCLLTFVCLLVEQFPMFENSKFCVKDTDAWMECFEDGLHLCEFHTWLSQLSSKQCIITSNQWKPEAFVSLSDFNQFGRTNNSLNAECPNRFRKIFERRTEKVHLWSTKFRHLRFWQRILNHPSFKSYDSTYGHKLFCTVVKKT